MYPENNITKQWNQFSHFMLLKSIGDLLFLVFLFDRSARKTFYVNIAQSFSTKINSTSVCLSTTLVFIVRISIYLLLNKNMNIDWLNILNVRNFVHRNRALQIHQWASSMVKLCITCIPTISQQYPLHIQTKFYWVLKLIIVTSNS